MENNLVNYSNTGGVRIKSEANFNVDNALSYFIENSDFKILTDESISCITILATLHTTHVANSPYRSMYSQKIDDPVSQILLKFYVWNNTQSYLNDPDMRDGPNNMMEMTTTDTIINESTIQYELFYNSIIENYACEPICPAILAVHANKLDYFMKRYLYQNISQRFTSRSANPNRPNRPPDTRIIDRLFNHYDIAFVAMEFIEDSNTLHHYVGNSSYNDFYVLSLYELSRMHNLGYLHKDFHTNNRMIMPNYRYIRNRLGRSVVIDFGRSIKHNTQIPNVSKEKVLFMQQYETDKYTNVQMTGIDDASKIDYVSNAFDSIDKQRSIAVKEFHKALYATFNTIKDIAVLFPKLKFWNPKYIRGGKIKNNLTEKIDNFSKYKTIANLKKNTYTNNMYAPKFDTNTLNSFLNESNYTEEDDIRYATEIREQYTKQFSKISIETITELFKTGLAPPVFINTELDTTSKKGFKIIIDDSIIVPHTKSKTAKKVIKTMKIKKVNISKKNTKHTKHSKNTKTSKTKNQKIKKSRNTKHIKSTKQ